MSEPTESARLWAFGLAVREHRQLLAMSQEAFADHSGFHRTYISGVERGQRNPSLLAVFRLASGLGVSAAELMAGAERHLDSAA
jgi:transcriptional regulator with XRE-family HTH domain